MLTCAFAKNKKIAYRKQWRECFVPGKLYIQPGKSQSKIFMFVCYYFFDEKKDDRYDQIQFLGIRGKEFYNVWEDEPVKLYWKEVVQYLDLQHTRFKE